MVQATQDRNATHYPSAVLKHDSWWHWCRLPKALVRPLLVEVVDVLAERMRQMALAQDEHVVQALAPHAPEEPLAGGVLPGRAVGRAQLLDAARRRDLGERPAELPVVIVDEIPGPPAIGRGLTQLLRDPGVGRLPRHPDMDHAARAERDDDERGQRAEEEVRHRQEVAGPDVRSVGA
jgi:hypothetical protein